MNPKGTGAFTVTEMVIAVLIVLVLAALTIPAVTGTVCGNSRTAAMFSMRQIYLATQQMALEGSTTGDTNLCWPGNMSNPNWAAFQKNLVPAYVDTNDFLKLLGAREVKVPDGFPNPVGENAFKVFAVKKNDPGDTIFMVTRNWMGFQQPLSKTSPYGEKGFALIRKGGDAAQYGAKQATSSGATNGGFLGRTNGIVISQ